MLACCKMFYILNSSHHILKMQVELSYRAQFVWLYCCSFVSFLFRFVYNIVEVLSWCTCYTYIAFCSYVFVCFHPCPYILNVLTSSRKIVDKIRPRIPQFILKNMSSIWTNFNQVFEVIQGLFFAFLLKRKDGLGTRLILKIRSTAF